MPAKYNGKLSQQLWCIVRHVMWSMTAVSARPDA